MPPIDADSLSTLLAFAERLPWLFGLVVLALYRKPILAALQRSTRDPLIDALTDQNKHFAENNKLFRALGPALEHLVKSTADTAEASRASADQLTDLLAVQRSIEKELIRGGKPR